MTQPMINHRGPEFAAILREVTAGLKPFFQTQNDILTMPASGTGGLECAVVNTLSPGERVLAVSIGVFGDRFAQIAEVYGADVQRLKYELGQAADPAEIGARLDADPAITTVLVTHNETSTGVANPIEPIAKAVKARGKLLLIDAVSSLSCIELKADEWGCDVVVTGSQKGWMVPPGLAMISISAQAWQAHATAKMPRFYWDWSSMKKSLEKGQNPVTPPVSLFYGLQVALKRMEAEGREHILARHTRIGDRTRTGVKRLGLSLLAADERYASNTVTAVWVPEGVDGKALTKLMRAEYDVVLAGGQQSLEGKIFRIGHLGLVSEADIDDCLNKLAEALPRLGFSVATPVTTARA